LEFSKDTDGFHPTQKPVALIRRLVLTYTNEGDTVLDNCMGSGTTAIACIKENRHFIGFELNEEYYKKACERIWNEQRQLKLF
jgi:site-specific DNA-methyltransferase (adenine-specific)